MKMNVLSRNAVAVTVLALGGASIGQAGVLIGEPFSNPNFTLGNLVGQPGAAGGDAVNLVNAYTGDDTAAIAYQSAGLDYSYDINHTNGLAEASGGSVVLNSTDSGANLRNIRERTSSQGPGDYFFSLLMRYDGGGDPTDGAKALAGFDVRDSNGGRRSIQYGFRNNAGTIEAIIEYKGVVNILSSSITPGETYFVVASIDDNAAGGSSDPVTTYFNPGNVTTEADADATSSKIVTNAGPGPHGQVPYRGIQIDLDGALDGATFDEILLGQTWADVTPVGIVPEPASLALLGLGGLALIRRR